MKRLRIVFRPNSIQIILASLFVLTGFGQTSAHAQEDNDAVARELSNPASSLASLGNKIELRGFDGNLPDADDQTGVRYIFQPVLPFNLSGGDKIIFRPAFNVPIDEPVFDSDQGRFTSDGGFGDIIFDLIYSPPPAGNLVYGAGFVGGIPTSTSTQLRSENWTAGPEIFAAFVDTWGVAGGLLTHSWDVAGSGRDTSLTTFNYFAFASLGDGWQLGAGPIVTYDWEAASGNRWNVPVGIGLAKTTSLGGVPLKLNVEIDYSLVRQDSFGPEWLLKFSITPVIKNPFQ
jgi:hypothetical protein